MGGYVVPEWAVNNLHWLKWPAIALGIAVVVGFWVGIFLGLRWLARELRRVVSGREFVAFVGWGIAVFTLALLATLTIVHQASASRRSIDGRYLVIWGLTWGGSILALTLVAGLVVFRRERSWSTVLTWPWLIGPVVGFAYFLGASGQSDAGSKLCNAPTGGSCDTAWGLGAILLSVAAGVVLSGSFIMASTLRRLLPPRHRLSR